MATEEPSYIDYDTFLDPDFSATSFANDLVLSTNDPTDTPLDLSTPLSRVLFDVQEIDIHIDNLTTKSAGPLLDYTQTRSDASAHILDEVSTQLDSLNEGYKRLEKDVIARFERADQVRLAAERLCATLKLGRAVSRCFTLGRQLDSQMTELGISASAALTSSSVTSSNTSKVRENHRAMVGAARSVLELRSEINSRTVPGLEKITTVTALRNNLLTPLERSLISLAQQTVREFSVSSLPTTSTSATGSNPTYLQSEQAKSRTTSALAALYLLSPCPPGTRASSFEPRLLLSALSSYLQANITSSQASLARALATLPTLDRTLTELSGRCANIVALAAVLASTPRGAHPGLSTAPASPTDSMQDAPLLPLILHSLDTSSLPSYFWRTLAQGLAPRVGDILSRGGVSARTLRSNKERVVGAVRECVLKSAAAARGEGVAEGGWGKGEREAAVMVGGILGPLGR
ncbi:hypothetical protein K461DRAFT_232252 [Myriangium duriaei CBS 260.36]|uniref:Conserved oligomeric Golgi complex subunit 5 n=1 Tax=Myriangium duriaei CBS 260.36 TaxID=1168546 RepID=A0A9P4IRS7_9PEZI|nr:hypothetical protein K461DRAFT_232252 [Myriangium duriaei CBS 260.36]